MVRIRCIVFSVGLLALFAVGAKAQIALELPAGTSMDATVRAYGWPKGRSASGAKEVWTYDRFQVTFVDGAVETVSALPISKQRPSRAPNAQGNLGPPRSAQPSGPGKQGQTPVTATVSPQPSPEVTVPRRGYEDATQTPVEPPPRRSAGEEMRSVLWNAFKPAVYFLLGLGAVMVCVITLLVMRRRSLRDQVPQSDVMFAQPTNRPAAQPTDWRESIAERLARQHAEAGQVEEPPTSHDAAAQNARTELTHELLLELEWKRFELVVARYFEATGVRAELTCNGADGGVDVCLYRVAEERPYAYVQCKAYGNRFIDAEKIRALFGVMAAAGVAQGVFVTTSQFGNEARRFAAENGIETIDGSEFVRRFARLAPEVRSRIVAEVTAGDYRTPTCPSHDIKMVERVNGSSGSRFYACPQFRCRRTINVRSL